VPSGTTKGRGVHRGVGASLRVTGTGPGTVLTLNLKLLRVVTVGGVTTSKGVECGGRGSGCY
jgi:hypothetical protein